MTKTTKQKGFTLIEVLLALAIISIALAALLKASAQNVATTQRLKDKMISHWVAMQGIAMIQLDLFPIIANQELTKVTNILDQRWYWRAKINSTTLKSMQQITITVSKKLTGPFRDPLIGYRYHR